ncbi:MAG: S41 family peptidase [Clostridia bacterium]|jgi:carboxyl-terminal processing protease|nr:S41 family peptidase [Clostridia bacterium]
MKPYMKTVLTVAVTAVLTFGATSVYYAVNAPRYANNPRTGTLKEKLDVINTYIEKNYLYEDVDYNKADEAAVKAYVGSLDEPYTRYYDKDEFEEYMGKLEEGYVGIGVIVAVDDEKDRIMVLSAFINSPAYEAGLKPGDYIISAEGKEFKGTDMDECVATIKNGKEGTRVKLKIERDGQMLDFEIERKEVVENSVLSKMLDNDIGYVSILGFNTNKDSSNTNTYTEFVDAVKQLQDSGMKKMIIDLRDNPGGVLEVVCNIADYLLPEGLITYTETKDGKRNEHKSDKSDLNIPMVVLINGRSASASEVLSGALKDYGRADIVGTKSFGKGIVQSVFPLWDGSGMSMTISKYYTPNGKCIHGIGIEPDYTVELPEKYKESYVSDIPIEDDTQLNKAIEILKKK